MKDKWVNMYLDMALRAAEESHAIRLKVGAIFVSSEGVMSMGINGLPAGGDNECEDRSYLTADTNKWPSVGEIEKEWPYLDDEELSESGSPKRFQLKTKDEVSHAEENLFSKLMRQGVSTKGGKIFVTASPCIRCSKIIVNAGITAVYYIDNYKDDAGINWLKTNNLTVIKVEK